MLSDTQALRTCFSKGVVFTDNSAGSIAQAMEQAVAEKDHLQDQVRELKSELIRSWQRRQRAFEAQLKASGLSFTPGRTPRK